MKVVVGSYTGNGSSLSVAGMSGQPSMVWVVKSATAMVFRTSTMITDGQNALALINTTNPTSACITSLDSNGFSVDSSSQVNTANELYYYAAFINDGGNDFIVGKYTGDGTTSHAISGLAFQPNFVGIKGVVTSSGAFRTSSHTSTNSSRFGNLATVTTCIRSIGATSFTLSSNASVNTNGVVYYYWCWKSAIVGTYTGDGTSVRDISVGSTFGLFAVKSDTTDTAEFRTSIFADGLSIAFSGGFNAGLSKILRFVPTNLAEIGNNASVNTNAVLYYWWALPVTINISIPVILNHLRNQEII